MHIMVYSMKMFIVSLFTALNQIESSNILPIRLDGATKEFFAWGLRVGFLTFGLNNNVAKEVLEAKVKGLIRSNISSGPMPSQSAIKYVLENHDEFDKEIQQNIDTLQERYEVTKSVVYDDKYKIIGKPMILILLFMAVKVNGVNPEELRTHLINEYSIGIIALNDSDIRIAFSCIEKMTFHMF